MSVGLDQNRELMRLHSGMRSDSPPTGFSRFEIDIEAAGDEGSGSVSGRKHVVDVTRVIELHQTRHPGARARNRHAYALLHGDAGACVERALRVRIVGAVVALSVTSEAAPPVPRTNPPRDTNQNPLQPSRWAPAGDRRPIALLCPSPCAVRRAPCAVRRAPTIAV